jgi:peptide/nickel transport system substrate-binding protein
MENGKGSSSGLTRRIFLCAGGVGIATIALAGVSPLGYGAEKKRPKYGGRLRIAERFGSTGLDAHKNQTFIDIANYDLMYNALTIPGPLPDLKMYPDLAESWEVSTDARDYTFSLRKGVKFHHGKELDSSDVKYSIERVMNPATMSPRAYAYQWIDSVTTIDKYHVRIRLKEVFGPFLTTLTSLTCPIIPAGWAPTGIKPAPGTGPFVLKSFVPNETTEFTRFDQYWENDEKTGDRLPYLDGVYVKKIPDQAVRWTALRAGDMDYIAYPPRQIAAQEQKHPTPGIVTVNPSPIGAVMIFFNVSKPPFDNKKVREAVAYAIDKKELIQAALWGLGEPINNQPFLNRSRSYVPVQDRETNLAKAKQLLAEAGYPNGLQIEFLQIGGSTEFVTTEPILGQLSKAGISGTLKIIDAAPWIQSLRKGDYNISIRNDQMRFDPDDAYYINLHSGEIGKNNWSRYQNRELDTLLDKGRRSWKWEDRVPVYKRVVEIIKEDLPVLYLCSMIGTVSHRDYVHGHEFGMATYFNYYRGGVKKAWFDK